MNKLVELVLLGLFAAGCFTAGIAYERYTCKMDVYGTLVSTTSKLDDIEMHIKNPDSSMTTVGFRSSTVCTNIPINVMYKFTINGYGEVVDAKALE